MAPESLFVHRDRFVASGAPLCSFNMFRGMLPLQGLLVSVVVLNLAILARSQLAGGPIPNASGEAGLYWGHLLGGPLLAMGAVFMIGCEVRTYGRLGLGYGTALAALPGFYLGYLPYTLFKEPIDAAMFGAGLTSYLTVPQWLNAHLGGGETTWILLYSSALLAMLAWSFDAARRFFALSCKRVFSENTDSLVYAR
jgi:hypothetical protein